MNKPRVLFVCIHNSSRSQMAEGFLRSLCGDCLEAHSAGLEAGQLNPLAVEAMAQVGIDISRYSAKPLADFTKAGTRFDWVITVCDETNAERCPVFPGGTRREHWSFPDPSAFSGTHEERLQETTRVRDAIRAKIEVWCADVCPAEPARH
jgi:arsenate reductase (thioredoxin)